MVPTSKFLFPIMVFLNFLNYTTYGIPAAFYPNIARNKGASSFFNRFGFCNVSYRGCDKWINYWQNDAYVGFENRIIDLGGTAEFASVIYFMLQIVYIIGFNILLKSHLNMQKWYMCLLFFYPRHLL